MRAFVTGASGFIGSYLVKELVDDGHEVLCLKRSTSNLEAIGKYIKKIQFVDYSDNWKTVFCTFKPDIIYNLAWNGVAAADRVYWNRQISNIAMQQDLLELAIQVGCRKFVGIGSQSEYGDFNEKIDEEYPVNPKTAYAAIKVACLTIMKAFCELHKIEWYWFRLFPVFGPHESDNWLIPSLIKNILTEDHMDLTPGEQKLSYLYVGECAKAIMMAIYADNHSGVYNICSDNPIPLKTLVEKIRDKINQNFQLNFGALSYRYGQSMYMEGDTTALRKNIYNLNTSDFDDKLSKTIEYYINIYKNGKR